MPFDHMYIAIQLYKNIMQNVHLVVDGSSCQYLTELMHIQHIPKYFIFSSPGWLSRASGPALPYRVIHTDLLSRTISQQHLSRISLLSYWGSFNEFRDFLWSAETELPARRTWILERALEILFRWAINLCCPESGLAKEVFRSVLFPFPLFLWEYGRSSSKGLPRLEAAMCGAQSSGLAI